MAKHVGRTMMQVAERTQALDLAVNEALTFDIQRQNLAMT